MPAEWCCSTIFSAVLCPLPLFLAYCSFSPRFDRSLTQLLALTGPEFIASHRGWLSRFMTDEWLLCLRVLWQSIVASQFQARPRRASSFASITHLSIGPENEVVTVPHSSRHRSTATLPRLYTVSQIHRVDRAASGAAESLSRW